MSSPGFFYSADDQAEAQALARRQAYAQALMEQGGQDPGRGQFGGLRNAGNTILGAYLTKKANAQQLELAKQAQGRYTSDLANLLKGPNTPTQSPQVSTTAGTAPQVSPAATEQAPGLEGPQGPQGAPVQPMPAMPSQAPAPPSSSFLDRLVASGNPALLQQFAPTIIQNRMEMENKHITPLSSQETQALGLRGIWGRDMAGNPVQLQAPDTKSQAAIDQELDLARRQGELPLTTAQKAQNTLGYAQLNKPVSVGFGDTLVNPATGKPIYSGQSMSAPLGPDGKPLTGDAFLATLPAGMAATAKAIASYRQAPLTSMAIRSPQGTMLMQAVNQINPGYDSTQYGAKNKARLDFATGKNGNTVRSLNVAVQHLDQLGQLSDAMANGNVQAVNRIGNYFASQTGNPAPTNFNAAKQIVGDEIIKAIVGSGGGVSDREEAAHNISAASSPAQLAGVIKTYQGLMSGQLVGLRQQYQKSTGLSDFEDYLAPETRAKLEAHGAASGAAHAPSAGKVIRYDANGKRIQ